MASDFSQISVRTRALIARKQHRAPHLGRHGAFGCARLSLHVGAPSHTTPIRPDEVAISRESICFLLAAVALYLLPTFPSCSVAQPKLPITEPHGPLLNVYIVTLQTGQTLSHTHTHSEKKRRKKKEPTRGHTYQTHEGRLGLKEGA